MARKRKQLKPKQGAKPKEGKLTADESGPVRSPGDADAESRMDFGGLPDRDLKKNLGCG